MVAMQGSCGVARVQHGKEAREFPVLPSGQERFSQERLPRYCKFEYIDKLQLSIVVDLHPDDVSHSLVPLLTFSRQ